ncbi:MAG TPA: NAD(P)/FAD-dependent oxidoreductase [Pyrinomonadaceae bacterium]|jgi:flavin-dependent dehydrogenase|nr:NAD(P)/FAD-dependent oxidoreductase [Pyrinomonadaceae bacterium]
MEQKLDYDVIIAGAGPAGSSAAINLAGHGIKVLLVEQKKFPRPKLCGEFISPECLKHFELLGIPDRMLHAGGESIDRTVFYSRAGRKVEVPSKWFDTHNQALGLSRAEMDQRLLERAREVGVDVVEETQAVFLRNEESKIRKVQLKSDRQIRETTAAVVVDATGRARSLVHRLEANDGKRRTGRASLVAFKAHLENARPEPGSCEIYFYRGGYGGLNRVEHGLSNLCFIAAAQDVRACQADPEKAMRRLVAENSRAAETLAQARAHDQWLAVSLESFGRHEPAPADGLLTVGDAAAFIDPFTGSGMLMALQGGELVAGEIARHLPELRSGGSFKLLAGSYRGAYSRKFGSRLNLCGLLRRAAFAPNFAGAAIAIFGANDRLRQGFARATRGRRWIGS